MKIILSAHGDIIDNGADDNPADFAGVDQSLARLHERAVAQFEADHEHRVTAPPGLDDAVAVRDGLCHGFFQVEVLLCLEHPDGAVGMREIGRGDDHRVQSRVGQKGVDVGVGPNVVLEQPFVTEPADGRVDLILTDVAQAFDRERTVADKSRTAEADAAAAQAKNTKSKLSVFHRSSSSPGPIEPAAAAGPV